MEVVNKDLMLSNQHISSIGRDEFETALSHIRVGHGFVTPEILLLQLQFGTIDPEKIRGHIMEFDSDSIGQALNALIKRGLQ